ncbi:hypothetical protein VCHA43P277_160020 [Vibrio chagasii]|nr:hypothetical protein VCHA34P126_140024 [Vibrio chagasii]CAH6977469.1 hypothetical protein VCHA43P277_160020 [Vibrio chagasii]CAH7026262.1 hypothetical protein VCHA41O247_160021 [Vibrio chagasii]CAH7248786.1 hypothetical protein VCHA50P420_160106 [Vibrio chagasii]
MDELTFVQNLLKIPDFRLELRVETKASWKKPVQVALV